MLVEDEDNREATVCAQIDFPLYRDMARSGISAESIFMHCEKCDTISRMREEKKSVSERVKDSIAEEMAIDRKKVSEDSSFIDDLGADEVDFVGIVIRLEEDFGIAIPDKDADLIRTVGQAVAYVEKRLEEKDDGKEEAKA